MEITPEKLEFHAPFTKHTSNNLELRNPTNEYFAFKVKTTAPKLFCVRPNASIVAPNETLTVSITHQALPQEPGPDYTSKDKFLILSAPLNEAAVQAGENLANFVEKTKENIAEFWTQAEHTKSVPITSKKMKVQVRPFDANGQHTSHELGAGAAGLGAGAVAGGVGAHSTPRGDQTFGDESFANYEAAAQSPAPHSPANQQQYNNFQQQQQQQYQQHSSGASGIAGHATEAVNRGAEAVGAPSATSQVHSQDSAALGQAQDNISSLKKDIGGVSEKHSVPSTQTSQAVGSQGVPVGVVAIVALLALLVGWFFL